MTAEESLPGLPAMSLHMTGNNLSSDHEVRNSSKSEQLKTMASAFRSAAPSQCCMHVFMLSVLLCIYCQHNASCHHLRVDCLMLDPMLRL